ncbi:MAG: DUF47 family protein [bacterium]|nr:DUF47 family protein [bacterium]
MSKLFPKDRWFFEQFNNAAQGTHEAAKVFVELLSSQLESTLNPYVQKIKELEHQGDRLTHSVVDRLNKSFLTPFDREDIYSLIGRLDDVLDMLDGASSRIILYRVGPPQPKMLEQVKVLERATAALVEIISIMQPRMNYSELLPYFEKLHQLENDGDQLQREVLSELFEAGKDPIYVIKMKEIHEFIEQAIDKCEDVANVVEGICVKNA